MEAGRVTARPSCGFNNNNNMEEGGSVESTASFVRFFDTDWFIVIFPSLVKAQAAPSVERVPATIDSW